MPVSTRLHLPPPVRRHRPVAALGLAAVVLGLHGGLIGALAPAPAAPPGATAPGPARVTAVQVRAVVPPLAQGAVAAPATAGAPAVAPRAATAAAVAAAVDAATPAAAAWPSPVAREAPAAGTADTASDAGVAQVAPAAPAAQAAQAAASALVRPAPADAWPASQEGAVDSADRSIATGEAPPVYATRIPPPVRLRYALRYNGRAGEATLVWQHDGLRYRLVLEGHDAGELLVRQASQGGFDSAGLAPERFTDRRRGSRLQAANFRRDIGRIGFSGPVVDYPAWPGAQDRLSWLVQFVAIRAAAALAAPAVAGDASTTRLFVVDARGAAAWWHFRHEGEAGLTTSLGPLATQHWRREPPRPEGLRVEAWLDPARGHWPVQLRFTALRSGDVFELLLQDEPGAPLSARPEAAAGPP